MSVPKIDRLITMVEWAEALAEGPDQKTFVTEVAEQLAEVAIFLQHEAAPASSLFEQKLCEFLKNKIAFAKEQHQHHQSEIWVGMKTGLDQVLNFLDNHKEQPSD